MAAYIQKIATALPQHRYGMQEIVSFLTENAATSNAKRKARIVAQKSGIEHRFSVLEDFRTASNPALFNGHVPLVEQRMRVYQDQALPLAMKAIEKLDVDPKRITHIITVSCTGMTAPGLELQLAKALGLNHNAAKHAVNFVGCHGAFHGLKMANAFLAQDARHSVLLVSVELCSLHYQPSNDDDSILANVLFGDGAAACLLGTTRSKRSIEMKGFEQQIIPDDDGLMAWNIHSSGFLLKLSSYVPKAIETGINRLLDPKSSKASHWAVHPGGKNILEAVMHQLQLSQEALHDSFEVLRQVGNLSSATILFVLQRMLESDKVGALTALGFGPGLSLEIMHAELIGDE